MLEILIGKNRTGKSYYLEDEMKKYKKNFGENNILYIPTDIDISNYIDKENLGTATNPNLNLNVKIINFINSLINHKKEIKITKDDKDKIKKNQEEVESIIEIDNSSDIYFENNLKNYFKVEKYEDILKKDSIEYKFSDLIKFQAKNKDFLNISSSGTAYYSFLKYLTQIITKLSLNEDFEKENKKIFLDEPEKFCHPELIEKIATILWEISQHIDVIITTHSPVLLNKIYFLAKKGVNNDAEEKKVKFKFFYEILEVEKGKITGSKKIDLDLINKLKEFNSEETSQMINILFSSNVIFVEGLNDFIYIDSVIKDKFNEYYVTIINCNGKGSLKKAYNWLNENINHDSVKIKTFAIYDEDLEINKKNYSFPNQIMFSPDLEKSFFEETAEKNNFKVKNLETEKISKNGLKDYFDYKIIKDYSTKKENEIEDINTKNIKEIKNWLE